MSIYRLTEEIAFPDPVLAEEDGLLAIGGDLSMERLLLAYSYGIFPWYNPKEEKLWWCPKRRYLIFPREIHISKSMRKFLKKNPFEVFINRDFKETIHQCRMVWGAAPDGTWITDEMEEAYNRLYENGFAISVETYKNGELVGGLYGVSLGKCFFGESMFSKAENASKVALAALAKVLAEDDYLFIDCQFYTQHLESMGGRYVEWDVFDAMLKKGIRCRWK